MMSMDKGLIRWKHTMQRGLNKRRNNRVVRKGQMQIIIIIMIHTVGECCSKACTP